MKAQSTIRNQPAEAGIALLISIFILLLISVVGIALIVSSGTESALAGNYRSATGVYYASLAGLEEARGRLLNSDPNSFKNTAPAGFLPLPGTQWDIGYVRYVLNPGPADPADTRTAYPDGEYDQEFGANALANASGAGTVATTQSVWNVAPLNGLPVPGPLYKWVRINPISEVSLGRQVAPYGDGHVADPTKPIYYDGTLLTVSPTGAREVLEITSLAVLPNASQKLVQYLVAPLPITLPPFLAALTLSGSQNGTDPVFQPPTTNAVYAAKGDGDQDCNGNPLPSKVAVGLYGPYQGVGTLQNALNGIKGGIPSFPPPSTAAKSNYTGQGPWPDVEALSPPFQTPTELNNIVQTIIQSADAVVPAGSAATQTSYLNSLNMSPTNMLTVVSNGDLDLTHWGNTGYGLLLVTGTFTMDPDNGWHGIILVIGEGKINNTDNTGSREFDGAVFVAKTNIPGPDLGGAWVGFDPDMQGNGIRYSSCWIQRAQPMSSYKILSFHEISQ